MATVATAVGGRRWEREGAPHPSPVPSFTVEGRQGAGRAGEGHLCAALLSPNRQWKSSPTMKNLKKKHVLITGGSSGIGLALAKEALSQGAFVTLIARSSSKLDKALQYLVQELAFDPNRICTKIADVGDYERLSVAMKESFEWRPIDVLVCNAGVAKTAYLDEALISDLQGIIQTNLTGTVNTLHIALPLMKERQQHRGHLMPASVVLMSSLSALWGAYGNSVYTATKCALKGLAETLRFELMPFNIRVSIVYPGFVETPMLDESGMEHNRDILQILNVTSSYDRRRAESTEEVAKYTLEAAKKGTFMVASRFTGLWLSTLTRGFVPADSFGRAVIELILCVPLRLVSFIVAAYFEIVVRHYQKKFSKRD
eukprot:Gb_16076 [translate_table: standard]